MVSTGYIYIYYKSITTGREATVFIGIHHKWVLCPKNGYFRHIGILTSSLHFELGLTKCLISAYNISRSFFLRLHSIKKRGDDNERA